jgi:hypothetical protein
MISTASKFHCKYCNTGIVAPFYTMFNQKSASFLLIMHYTG